MAQRFLACLNAVSSSLSLALGGELTRKLISPLSILPGYGPTDNSYIGLLYKSLCLTNKHLISDRGCVYGTGFLQNGQNSRSSPLVYPQNQACDMFSFEFLEAKYSPTIIMGDYFASRNLNGTVETFP